MTDFIAQLIKRHPCLEECEKEIRDTVNSICLMQKEGGKLLLCGNGGSAADCEHISGELMKGFLLERSLPEGIYDLPEKIEKGLQSGVPAIPLSAFGSVLSAFSNDADPELAFSQIVFVLGKKEDLFLGISTSGNSENIISAAVTAKAKGMKALALTGKDGGRLGDICDTVIKVPEEETYKVQELHLPVYHAICAQCEEILFG